MTLPRRLSPNGPLCDFAAFGSSRMAEAILLMLVLSLTVVNALADPPPCGPRVPDILDEMVPRLMAKYHVPGVSIVGIENNHIAWHREYGVCQTGKDQKVDENTLFEACSMSKPVFAYAVLRLVEQGRLDLDKPLVDYLDKPYLPNEPLHRRITARMVLSHTTGFPNWREKGKPLHVLFEPGARFEYSGEGYVYLQRVVEHITGQRLDRWIRHALLEPVGMKTSNFVWNDRVAELVAAGHDEQGKIKTSGPRFLEPNAAASLFCTPREYAMFQLEMMRRDRTAAHSLRKPMLDEMLSHASKADPRKPVKRLTRATSNDVYYGLGWQMDSTPRGERYYHAGLNAGGFCCYNEFDPNRGRGIVIMTNSLGGNLLWEAVIAAIAP
jgi:CubicO group peptidase (beta-lactamase class C family)